MDAKSFLGEIGRLLRQLHIEAVLIGNAAAALQGAPVTTVDFDFLFRKTPRNLSRLKALARELGGFVGVRPRERVCDLQMDVDGMMEATLVDPSVIDLRAPEPARFSISRRSAPSRIAERCDLRLECDRRPDEHHGLPAARADFHHGPLT